MIAPGSLLVEILVGFAPLLLTYWTLKLVFTIMDSGFDVIVEKIRQMFEF